MVIHVMHLQPEPFACIANGSKTCEVRLRDQKRKRIIPGDMVEFIHANDQNLKLLKRINAITIAQSFAALFESIGHSATEVASMRQYYSHEAESLYGVLALHFQ